MSDDVTCEDIIFDAAHDIIGLNVAYTAVSINALNILSSDGADDNAFISIGQSDGTQD